MYVTTLETAGWCFHRVHGALPRCEKLLCHVCGPLRIGSSYTHSHLPHCAYMYVCPDECCCWVLEPVNKQLCSDWLQSLQVSASAAHCFAHCYCLAVLC